MLSNESVPAVLWNGEPFDLAALPVGGLSLSTALAHIYASEKMNVASIQMTGAGLGVNDITALILPTNPECCDDCRIFLSYLEIVGKLQRFLKKDEHVEIVLRNGLPYVEPTENWQTFGILDVESEPLVAN